MKSIILAMALIATGVHAAEVSDDNPCDKVENDVQTLECSAFSKTSAEDLLKENLQGLTERMQSQYGKTPSQLADITAKIKAAQQQWLKTRDADCAVEAFPATSWQQGAHHCPERLHCTDERRAVGVFGVDWAGIVLNLPLKAGTTTSFQSPKKLFPQSTLT